MKKIIIVITVLTILSFKLYSQDTSTVVNVHLSEENFWGQNKPQKATNQHQSKISEYWAYPIKYATEGIVQYYEHSPVKYQNMIVGENALDKIIKNGIINKGADSLLSSRFQIDFFELKQVWNFNDAQNKLEVSTLKLKPSFVAGVVFDAQTFIEEPQYTSHDIWIDLKETNKPKGKEIGRVVLGVETSLSNTITKKLLSNKHILGYSQYKSVWKKEGKQVKEKIKRDTIQTAFIDTLVTFDPETFAEYVRVEEWTMPLNSKNYEFTILQELIFYENGEIDSQVLGLIPIRLINSYNYIIIEHLSFLSYEKDALKYLNKGIFRKIKR